MNAGSINGAGLMRCAYCGRRYLWSTFPLRIEATCVDCWPFGGWPRRFHLLGKIR